MGWGVEQNRADGTKGRGPCICCVLYPLQQQRRLRVSDGQRPISTPGDQKEPSSMKPCLCIRDTCRLSPHLAPRTERVRWAWMQRDVTAAGGRGSCDVDLLPLQTMLMDTRTQDRHVLSHTPNGTVPR